MRWYLSLVLAIIPVIATANIYRSIDASGNVVYSDKPTSGATPIDLPPLQGYSPATTSPPTTVASAQPTTIAPAEPIKAEPIKTDSEYYQFLRISAPVDGASVQNSGGQLDVAVSLLPSLRSGDKLVITVDDEPVVETPDANVSFILQNVPRGTHRLQAHIIGSDAHLLKTSENITFYMHQASMSQMSAHSQPASSEPPATASAADAIMQTVVMK